MSMNFSLLRKAALEDRIAHLLLFHGSGGEDRYKAVLELAVVLNCRGMQIPCGECLACKKILSGNHPDVHIIRPLKTSIGIEQVLALQSKIYRKIYEGKYRVCLIEEAEKLTLPAANALLKIAEEPPDQTVIVLSTANAEGIISTLQSRAQAVYYSPPSEEEWKEEKKLFCLSGGNPDLARKISEHGVEQVTHRLSIYKETVEAGDFLKLYALFPIEREECLVLLQVITVWLKNKAVQGEASPLILRELSSTVEAMRRQANHRLALEVLALKHIKLGGTKIG